eukprot:CAMPEP_0205934488 /NCGR_PEP_ID=MMETSP1325-20131115/36517_1 /ASSEMBLY_ACC=CAM_ASM_000708 /TAXON_ID=236786 /ORGANISM="Florenciella sp., Strain RCC1007" /LENGTH=173 /DNA_ID=CAMNT_0053304477 /DNA_START=34 /DNA_END=552 /DNA_ORIENTATION=+
MMPEEMVGSCVYRALSSSRAASPSARPAPARPAPARPTHFIALRTPEAVPTVRTMQDLISERGGPDVASCLTPAVKAHLTVCVFAVDNDHDAAALGKAKAALAAAAKEWRERDEDGGAPLTLELNHLDSFGSNVIFWGSSNTAQVARLRAFAALVVSNVEAVGLQPSTSFEPH